MGEQLRLNGNWADYAAQPKVDEKLWQGIEKELKRGL